MNHELKRLLFTEEPFHDESFTGYMLRLAEMNEIPKISWILEHVGLRNHYGSIYKFNSDFKVDTKTLSKITGMDEGSLKNLLYYHEYGMIRNITGNIVVFGIPIPYYFVVREKPKICPLCLAERNYCRKVWELSPVTVCPLHKCLLLDYCRKCKREINWKRLKVSVCNCGADFRDFSIKILDNEEIKLSSYLYQIFSLSSADGKVCFDYPLDGLNVRDLLRVIFFFASHYGHSSDLSGVHISISLNNTRLHEVLCKTLNVFNNWAENYHQFIEWCREKDKNYYVNQKAIYLSEFQLSEQYSEYELLNQILHRCFPEDQFSFLRREFLIFLKKLSFDYYID
jgi:hypothetical protein